MTDPVLMMECGHCRREMIAREGDTLNDGSYFRHGKCEACGFKTMISCVNWRDIQPASALRASGELLPKADSPEASPASGILGGCL